MKKISTLYRCNSIVTNDLKMFITILTEEVLSLRCLVKPKEGAALLLLLLMFTFMYFLHDLTIYLIETPRTLLQIEQTQIR